MSSHGNSIPRPCNLRSTLLASFFGILGALVWWLSSRTYPQVPLTSTVAFFMVWFDLDLTRAPYPSEQQHACTAQPVPTTLVATLLNVSTGIQYIDVIDCKELQILCSSIQVCLYARLKMLLAMGIEPRTFNILEGWALHLPNALSPSPILAATRFLGPRLGILFFCH